MFVILDDQNITFACNTAPCFFLFQTIHEIYDSSFLVLIFTGIVLAISLSSVSCPDFISTFCLQPSYEGTVLSLRWPPQSNR